MNELKSNVLVLRVHAFVINNEMSINISILELDKPCHEFFMFLKLVFGKLVLINEINDVICGTKSLVTDIEYNLE